MHTRVCVGVCARVREREKLHFAVWLIRTQGWPSVQTNTLPPPQSKTPHGRHSGMITLTLPPSVHCGTTVGCTTERGRRMRGKTVGGTPFFLYTLVQLKDSLTLCFCLFSRQLLPISKEMLPGHWKREHFWRQEWKEKHKEREKEASFTIWIAVLLFTHKATGQVPLGEPRCFTMVNLISHNTLEACTVCERTRQHMLVHT